MRETSISKKLTLSNTIAFWITFALLGLVAIVCFAGLNNSFSELLESQTQSHVKRLIEDSKLLQDINKKSRLKLLREKGISLLQRGKIVLTPYMDENSLTALREYLKINYELDDEIGLVSFFVIEDDVIRSWQYISFTDLFTMEDEVIYDPELQSWVGDKKTVFDPDVLKILEADQLSVVSKLYSVGSGKQSQLVEVYDCYTPIFNVDEYTLADLRENKEAIGYLRYIVTHEQLKTLLKEEEKKLAQDIEHFKSNGAQQLAKAKTLLDRVKWETLFILVILGGAISALRGLYLNYYIKTEILDPVIKLSSSLLKVSEGDLSVVIEDSKRKDEIGVMSQSIEKLIETINLAVNEFDKQVEHIECGRFSYRGDDQLFSGSYVDLIAGGNRLIESFIAHLNVIQNMIIIVDSSGKILFANEILRQIVSKSLKEVLGSNIFSLFQWDIDKEVLFDDEVLKKVDKIQLECRIASDDFSYDILATSVEIKARKMQEKTYLLVLVDQTEIQRAQTDMKQALVMVKEAAMAKSLAQNQMVEAARLAGKADIASSVLHNVGNVLNSVNVSVSVLKDKVERSRSGKLGQALSLIQENKDDLGHYLTEDNKGKALLSYLEQLSEVLEKDNVFLKDEICSLEKGVEHIKEIVNVQQRYTKSVFGLQENFSIGDLLNDAIAFNFDVSEGVKVEVVNTVHTEVILSLDRHLLL
ncbi:HAMP domain-containing protein, partial [bacterium]|nr:HAMP domain-containing protein [bacterium]